MSFDWMSFATGFLEQTYSTIEENRKKASDYEDKLRENAERNATKIKDIKALKDAATSKYKQLMSKGIPETTIRAALASGPTGIADLEKAWSDAERKYGAEIIKANPDLYAAASITPEDAMLTGEGALSSDEFISRTLGLAAPTTGSVEAPRGNFLDILFNRNAKARVRAAMDKEVAAMGYSIYDLNEAANTAGYKSILPGAYVEYKSPNIFTPSQAADEAINLQRTLEQNDAYSEARKALAKAEEELAGSKVLFDAGSLSEDEYGDAQEAVATARERVSTVARTALGGILTTQAGVYQGDSYLKTLAPALDGLVGIPGFTSGFMTGEDAPTEESTDKTTPMVGTSQTEPAAQAPVIKDWADKAKKTAPTAAYGEVAIVEKDGEDVVVLAKPRMFGGTLVPAGTQLPKKIADEVMADIEAATPAETGTAAAVEEPVGVSKRRRRSNRGKPQGLGAKPVSEEDKAGVVIPYGDIKPGQGYGVEAFGPGNIFTNGKQTDTLPVDEATDALLRKSGLDMVNFARDKGLTKDSRPEELLDAITKWAAENDVSLPAGKSALIYAVKYGLGLRK